MSGGRPEDSGTLVAEKSPFHEAEICKVPPDLREWFEPDVLTLWIQEETKLPDWGNRTGAQQFALAGESESEGMICLLAFSYATGVFSSDEIVRNCRADSALQRLSGGKIPFRHELENARRQQRGALAGLLSKLFFRANSMRFTLEISELSPHWRQALYKAAMERMDIARHVNRDDDGVHPPH